MASTPRRRIDARTLHRWLVPPIGLFALYLGATGSIVQLVDVRAILSRAPATDPDMMAIRESIDGPSSFSVIQAPDYAAPALPAAIDMAGAIRTILPAARTAARGAPFRFVELRMAGGRPIGEILAADRLLRFDAVSGVRLADAPRATEAQGPPFSWHLLAKRWHRLWALGDAMLWLNALVGIGLLAMVVSGLLLYLRLWRSRARLGRGSTFWTAGGWLRTCHRSVALVAALVLLEVATTGTLLSIDSFGLQIYKSTHRSQLVNGQVVAGMIGDYSSPLSDAAVASMLRTSLAAYRAERGDRPIKRIRLRGFAGMPQGVFVAGGAQTQQLVYNAATGARARLSEPGYPFMGFPTGWELHELLKRIHRGDVLGVPGRLIDLLAGLSLVFLSGSGLWMYLDLWRRRRRAGRPALFWS